MTFCVECNMKTFLIFVVQHQRKECSVNFGRFMFRKTMLSTALVERLEVYFLGGAEKYLRVFVLG